MDWEAILSPNPAAFIASVSPWMYPAAAREPVQPPSGTGGLQAASAKLDSGTAEAQPPTGESGVHHEPLQEANLRTHLDPTEGMMTAGQCVCHLEVWDSSFT